MNNIQVLSRSGILGMDTTFYVGFPPMLRDLPDAQARCLNRLATWRYNNLQRGFTDKATGKFIPTDDFTRASVSQAIQALQSGVITAPVDYKSPQGWTSLQLTDLMTLAGAMAQYVQQCYSDERYYGAQVNLAPDVPTLQALIKSLGA